MSFYRPLLLTNNQSPPFSSPSTNFVSFPNSTMDLNLSKFTAHLLLFSSLLFLHSQAESTGSVLFLDSTSHQFLRSPSDAEIGPMSLPDIGAAISILLGFAPPPTLSAAGASKLNEVLKPNPFDRPCAVFMLEVGGTRDSGLGIQLDKAKFSSSLKSVIVMDSSKASIQLPDEDEVTVVSLDGSLSSIEYTDKDIDDFASWIGGSYVTDTTDALSGDLAIPLATGAKLNLHLSKKADKEFTVNLVLLIRDIRKAIAMHKDLPESMRSPAELLTGCFNGIKVLQEAYGNEGVAQESAELFMTAISKIFEVFQAEYEGHIVGVIFFNGAANAESDSMLDVTFTSRTSSRLLQEKVDSPDAAAIAIIRVALVRRTLAWITGIILLIATVVGIYFLMNMQLTKDTLLYSNVKLD